MSSITAHMMRVLRIAFRNVSSVSYVMPQIFSLSWPLIGFP